MMVAKIKYSFTIELGPNQGQTRHFDYMHGFHVAKSKIKNIIEPAYTGIRAYMKSFVKKAKKAVRFGARNKCSSSYVRLKKNFSGYWSDFI